MKEAGIIGRREILLQLGVVATHRLRELRELAHPRTPVGIAVLLEREDVLDSEPSVLAGLRERKALLVEEPNEVLAGYVEEVGGLLGGQLFADGHDRDRVPPAPGDCYDASTHCRTLSCEAPRSSPASRRDRPTCLVSARAALTFSTRNSASTASCFERADR
jgi:hypothetical protein